MACFTYVLPCVWEDHCKVGFSKDPLSRMSAFDVRWFERFDLDRAFLIESDTEREARDLELALRRPLGTHRAVMPTTIRKAAGGHTEWLRGAYSALNERASELACEGHVLHRPLRTWVRSAMMQRSDRIYSWASALWSAVQPLDAAEPRLLRTLVDGLDAFGAIDLDAAPWVPEEAWEWYRQQVG